MQDFSGAPPTPQPEGRTGGGSDDRHGPAGGELFPDAASDFGLKPRPKARRVDPLLGTDLGGITITRLLGEGGMGRVYEARQEDPPRTVAVKVIRQGIASEKTMRRFEREAEFLGRLQHPGIARIYVVGSYSSDDGDVPFFVMEFISNARPINHYAKENNLSLADRLRLFVSVCDAVSHGHDRGIVHRDLKPGNILIDSNGLPKVIDFGVARSTDSDFSLTSMKTDTGQLVGTVQYMSPEQFGDSPEGLDGRADVYSLGVVLYELLAGVLPYEVRKKKMHEAARIVCEEIPPPLRVRDRGVPRDVSLIVERCLEKNRRRRYQGAAALAADLKRHLAGERIPKSFKDVMRPCLRLAKGRSLAVMLVLVCLAAGVTVTFWSQRFVWDSTRPSVMAPTVDVSPAVDHGLHKSMESLQTSSQGAAAAVEKLRQHIESRGSGVVNDSVGRLLDTVFPLWLNEAERCDRALSRALVEASNAYPKVPKGDLVRRHEQWDAQLDALRSDAENELKDVKAECEGLVASAAASPADDALKAAEQQIKTMLDAWRQSVVSRAEALAEAGAADLFEFAREFATENRP